MAIFPTVPYAPVPIEWSEDSTLVARNSWGRHWGSNGWGAMTHEFFDREMYEAWAIEPKAAFPKYFGKGRQLIEWIPGSFPDRTFFAFSIVDADTDNRLAWTMAVHRRGEIHVEDLYVKPEFRRLGLGSELMVRLQSLQQELQQPLRFWIPFADVEDRASFTMLQEWFAANGFSIGASQRPWAAASAIREVDAIEYSSIQLPPKPAYVFQSPCTDDQVDWQSVRETFNVSQEFIDAAADVFSRHSEVLRRLA